MESYKEFIKYYGDNSQNMLEFFLKTEGCYMASAEGGFVLAYRCKKEDPDNIDLDGLDFYVQFCSGNWMMLMGLIEVDNIIFHRRGSFRSYKFSKLYSKMSK